METAPAEQPKIDCRKTRNKDKLECLCAIEDNQSDPRCAGKGSESSQLNDDQIYHAAYWLAQNGQYQEAVAQLKRARNQDDPRILNYLGFATRKLGRIDDAMAYYRKALDINPDYTLARAYMGEAFLEQDKPDLAREQLAEIEKRCGTSCVEFAELSGQIESFEATGQFKPQGKIDAAVKQAD
ncbi:MAG: tetratricopeptide repeat protein [Pseudomonadota bacterium]